MTEKQGADRFVIAISTMAISFAGATLRDFVLLSFLIVYWRTCPAGEDHPHLATGGGCQLCVA
jgi:hypothetical protein